MRYVSHTLSWVRYATVLAIIASGVLWALAIRGGVQDMGPKCEYADQPGIGSCDPNQGYVWQDECFDNDGCYVELEDCCAIVQ